MGCSRRVIQHIAIQQSEVLRAKFMADISAFDPNTIIWIDESGCDRRNSMRKYAYTIIGKPDIARVYTIHVYIHEIVCKK